MPPPPKAKWSTDPRAITTNVTADGTFEFSAPLLDDKIKAGTFKFSITADRELTVVWEDEPGAAGMLDFRAWMKEA